MEPRIKTPNTMTAKKYRDKYNNHNLHVSIMPAKGTPEEVQITICDNDPVTQDRSYANADLIEALINGLLQHEEPYSIEYILELIGSKSRSKRDLPGKIVEIFEKHLA